MILKAIEALFHPEELHNTLRTVAIVIGAIVVVHAFTSFSAPAPPAAVPSTAVAAPTAHPIAREAQAAVDTSKTLAQVNGAQVPAYAKNAVQIVCPGGFSPAQCFSLLQATRPKTAPAMNVNANMTGPTPAPTPTPGAYTAQQIDTLYRVAHSADAAAIAQSHIDVNAHLQYDEVPTSRLFALLSPAGSGAGFDVVRRKQFALVVGAIERSAHVSPVLGLHWEVPHTALSCGPIVYYDHRVQPQIACGAHF